MSGIGRKAACGLGNCDVCFWDAAKLVPTTEMPREAVVQDGWPGKEGYGLPVAPVLSWLARGVRPGAHFRATHDHTTRLDFALHALSQSFNIDLSGRRNSPALDFRQHRDNEFGGLV